MAYSERSLHDRLMVYCRRWSEEIDGLTEEVTRIAYFQTALPRLLLDRPLVRTLLEEIRAGRPYPDTRKAGFFENEILLYLDARGRYSLRVYFHGGGEYTVIHDHNGWGVSGVPSGSLGVVRYRLVESDIQARDGGRGGRPEYARIEMIDHRIHSAGEVTVTRPLASGIHQTGNPGSDPNMMITVYGRPVRRLYIQEYDPATRQIYRRYPPRILKRRLAAAVLNALR